MDSERYEVRVVARHLSAKSTSVIGLALITFAGPALLTSLRTSLDPQALCTPRPKLYEDWKRATAGPTATDAAARQHAETVRGTITFDPFDQVIKASEAQRARMDEHVLWENKDILVLLAKPLSSHEALVIPTQEMMFLIDAPEGLVKQLATVAAATSDAFMRAAGTKCDQAYSSRIYVSPPEGLTVRHLHVHVQRSPALGVQEDGGFYSNASKQLKAILDSTSRGDH